MNKKFFNALYQSAIDFRYTPLLVLMIEVILLRVLIGPDWKPLLMIIFCVAFVGGYTSFSEFSHPRLERMSGEVFRDSLKALQDTIRSQHGMIENLREMVIEEVNKNPNYTQEIKDELQKRLTVHD